ncbi:DUF2141 domain-containing protein [Microbulbifer halophilus]|uniref:DUF2141 domain-containing protein n=1 Tax=Microbulbifer halophilus TaxID=453963 RepID=UPI003614DD5E
MKILILPLLLILLFRPPTALAEDLSVRVHNLPPKGSLVLRVYSDPDSFADFRNPVREQRFSIRPGERYVVSGVPEGEVAVLAFFDENDNRALDKNFMGIPRESLGFRTITSPRARRVFNRPPLP